MLWFFRVTCLLTKVTFSKNFLINKKAESSLSNKNSVNSAKVPLKIYSLSKNVLTKLG